MFEPLRTWAILELPQNDILMHDRFLSYFSVKASVNGVADGKSRGDLLDAMSPPWHTLLLTSTGLTGTHDQHQNTRSTTTAHLVRARQQQNHLRNPKQTIPNFNMHGGQSSRQPLPYWIPMHQR
jgi:hypothetical protein